MPDHETPAATAAPLDSDPCGSYTRIGAPRITFRSARSHLLDNPLLRQPLRLEHVKPRLFGHGGHHTRLNFIYAHLNRVSRACDLSAIYQLLDGAPHRRSSTGAHRCS